MSSTVSLPAYVLIAWAAGYVVMGWLLHKATKP